DARPGAPSHVSEDAARARVCRETQARQGRYQLEAQVEGHREGVAAGQALERKGHHVDGRWTLTGQARHDLADERRELEAVAAARRADDDGPPPVDDEVFVRSRGVEAGLEPDGLGIDGRQRALDVLAAG